ILSAVRKSLPAGGSGLPPRSCRGGRNIGGIVKEKDHFAGDLMILGVVFVVRNLGVATAVVALFRGTQADSCRGKKGGQSSDATRDHTPPEQAAPRGRGPDPGAPAPARGAGRAHALRDSAGGSVGVLREPPR